MRRGERHPPVLPTPTLCDPSSPEAGNDHSRPVIPPSTLLCSHTPPSSLYLTLPPLPSLQASIPFAVIGSNQLIEVKGKKIRGRLYPWGVVEVENPDHNDFLKLRTMLV